MKKSPPSRPPIQQRRRGGKGQKGVLEEGGFEGSGFVEFEKSLYILFFKLYFRKFIPYLGIYFPYLTYGYYR